jgi:hypothetical protein
MADDEDDPQLGALRAAWRAMPDEDPPERGLAELMAAARAKAEELARPPWWRRALAQLRRPPVLALASVMVLLGGALVVGHRRDEVQSRATAPQDEPAPGASPTPAAPPAPTAAAAATPAPSTPTTATAVPTPAPTPAPAKDRERPQVPAHHAFPLRAHPPNHPPREAMPPPAALGGAAPTGAPARPRDEDTGGAGRGPAPRSPAAGKADEAPAADLDDGHQPAERGASEADVPAAPPPAPTAAPAPPPAAAPAPAPATNGTAASLATQCRAAAARGDCATARSLAARIQRDDPAGYAQLQRDATVAACLR